MYKLYKAAYISSPFAFKLLAIILLYRMKNPFGVFIYLLMFCSCLKNKNQSKTTQILRKTSADPAGFCQVGNNVICKVLPKILQDYLII
jgi:hypothetical protein